MDCGHIYVLVKTHSQYWYSLGTDSYISPYIKTVVKIFTCRSVCRFIARRGYYVLAGYSMDGLKCSHVGVIAFDLFCMVEKQSSVRLVLLKNAHCLLFYEKREVWFWNFQLTLKWRIVKYSLYESMNTYLTLTYVCFAISLWQTKGTYHGKYRIFAYTFSENLLTDTFVFLNNFKTKM